MQKSGAMWDIWPVYSDLTTPYRSSLDMVVVNLVDALLCNRTWGRSTHRSSPMNVNFTTQMCWVSAWSCAEKVKSLRAYPERQLVDFSFPRTQSVQPVHFRNLLLISPDKLSNKTEQRLNYNTPLAKSCIPEVHFMKYAWVYL